MINNEERKYQDRMELGESKLLYIILKLDKNRICSSKLKKPNK